MGLDVSHDCFSAPYSAFACFREYLCRAIGINMMSMEGFPRLASIIREDDPVPQTKWEALRPDPLHLLINHSDCDGEIAHEHCEPIARRLREVAPLLPADVRGARDLTLAETAYKFADGLMRAYESGEGVTFH